VPYSPTPRNDVWGIASGEVRAVLVVGDTLFIGGSFGQLRPPTGGGSQSASNVAAIDLRTGAPVPGWQGRTTGRVRALASDGSRLFVGGEFTSANGQPRRYLAALDVGTGALAGGWDANVSGPVLALRVANSSLYLGGQFSRVGGSALRNLARVRLDNGGAFTNFTPRPDRRVYGIDVTNDGGRVYVGGQFTAIGGAARQWVAGVDATTGASVGPVFTAHAYPLSVDVSPDGATLVTGHAGRPNLARGWNTTTGGELWRRNLGGNCQAVHVADANAYIGFHDNFQGNTLRKLLALDLRTGRVETSFQPNVNVYLGVWAITSYPGGLVAGGVFTQVNGVNARGVAVFPR
jgi:hypothetical protein